MASSSPTATASAAARAAASASATTPGEIPEMVSLSIQTEAVAAKLEALRKALDAEKAKAGGAGVAAGAGEAGGGAEGAGGEREAGGEDGQSVGGVKRAEEALKKAELEGRGTVEIKSSWLTSFDFFRAKLTRWSDDKTQPQVVVTVPDGCDPKGGAELIKKRLAYRHKQLDAPPKRKKKEKKKPPEGEEILMEPTNGRVWDPNSCIPEDFLESSSEEDSDTRVIYGWSPADWYKTARGNDEAIFTAVHFMHMTMPPIFNTLEVTEALSTCRVPCLLSVAEISASYSRRLLVRGSKPLAPSVISLDGVEHLIGVAVRSMERGARDLATRAIAGAEPSRELVRALVSAFCFLHISTKLNDGRKLRELLPERRVEMSIGRGFNQPEPPYPPAVHWVIRQLEDLVRRHPECARSIAMEGFHQITALRRTECHERYSKNTTKLFYVVLFMLFLQTATRDVECPVIPSVIRQFVRVVAKWPFDPQWDLCTPALISAATPLAQLAFLQTVSPKGSCDFLKDHVYLVHCRVRHILFDRIQWLSKKDRKWLSDADFPGFGEVPEGFFEATDDDDEPENEEYVPNYKHWPELQVAARFVA